MNTVETQVTDCKVVQFAEACMSLWPGREITIDVPEGIDELVVCDVFRALGCEVA